MKINSTVGLILVLLLVLTGVTLISGIKAYIIGYDALETVSQPNTKPKQSQLAKQENESNLLHEDKVIVSEKEILEAVNQKMNRDQAKAIPLQGNPEAKKSDSFVESE